MAVGLGGGGSELGVARVVLELGGYETGRSVKQSTCAILSPQEPARVWMRGGLEECRPNGERSRRSMRRSVAYDGAIWTRDIGKKSRGLRTLAVGVGAGVDAVEDDDAWRAQVSSSRS